MFDLLITIYERFDSRSLWDDIRGYRCNLTDMGEKSLIYGYCTLLEAINIITICKKYTDNMSVSLENEQV